MEVITKIVPESETSFGEIVQYIPSHSPSDTASALRRKTVVTSTDVLEAVKLDPAVLEAQITIDTSRNTSVRDKTDGLEASTSDGKDIIVKRESPSPSLPSGFERMMSFQQAALQSLTPQQYELLLKFADTLRSQRRVNQLNLECAFCKTNGTSKAWYSSHSLKTWRGKVRCPVLRAYVCPRCGATGDYAHTIKYCPDLFFTNNTSGNAM